MRHCGLMVGLGLSLGLAWPLPATSGTSTDGFGGPTAAAMADAAAKVNLLKALQRLKTVDPSQQLELLSELAATDPGARNLAAVVLRPELVNLRQAELEWRLGPAPLAELAHLAVGLHVEARSDERVRANLESLAAQIAPEGRSELLDLERWFDGATAAAATPPRFTRQQLSQATVWPIEEGSAYQRRLHTLTSENGQILIDGKPAEPSRPSENQDGVAKETLLHPNDPSLLVRVYHSHYSMDGFQKKNEKIENLTPLSAAGAAPKLIEHGEAPIDGKGRVYFYVQELAKGLTLKELAPEDRPLDQVKELFKRLIKAGLALIVPGPNQNWLLSNIMIGETASGGQGAYLLNGVVEPAAPSDLASHYDMLLAVVHPSAFPPKEADAGSTQTAPTAPNPIVQAPARLEARESADPKTVGVTASRPDRLSTIVERQVPGAPVSEETSEAVLRFASEQAAAEAASALLGDPEVARVQVHPRIKSLIEKAGAKPLYALLRLLPPSDQRDQLVLKIPASVFANTQSQDVAALFALMKDPRKAADASEKAWQRLNRRDFERFRAGLKNPSSEALAAIRKAWLTAHWGEIGTPALGGADLRAMLESLPRTTDRDELIVKIPGAVYAGMDGGEAAKILWLPSDNKDEEIHGRLPREAWRAMKAKDIESLMRRYLRANNSKLSAIATIDLQLWLAAHPDDLADVVAGGELRKLLELAPKDRRDEVILKIPATAYAKMTSADAAGLIRTLREYNAEKTYPRLPLEAWRRLDREDARRIIEAKKSGVVVALRMLAKAQLGRPQEEALTGRDFVALVELLDEGYWRNLGLVEVLNSAGSTLDGASVADLLALARKSGDTYPSAVINLVDKTAWQSVGRADAERLIKHWVTLSGYNIFAVGATFQRWLDAHADEKADKPVAGQDVAALWKLVPSVEAQTIQDFVLGIPGPAYAKRESADVADLLSLLPDRWRKRRADSLKKVPKQAWEKIGRADLERLMKQWRQAKDSRSANAAFELWMAAHSTDWDEGAHTFLPLLELIPDGDQRTAWTLKIPAAAFLKIEGAPLSTFLSEHFYWSKFEELPREAWQVLSLAEAMKLLDKVKGYSGASGYMGWIAKGWASAHQAQLGEAGTTLKDLEPMVELLSRYGALNAFLKEIPAAAWGKMEGLQVRGLLYKAEKDSELEKLPKEAWLKLRLRDVESIGSSTISELWRKTREEGENPARASGEDFVKTLKILPPSASRDEMILKLPGVTYSAMDSGQVAEVLSLVGCDAADADAAPIFRKIPEEAWYKLSREHLEPLLKQWADKHKEATVKVILDLWLKAHQ